MSENYLESRLTKNEMLVYEYIKLKTEEQGSVQESMIQMAESISEMFKDRISVRKVHSVGGASSKSKKGSAISTATISRAVNRLKAEGIIDIRQSPDSTTPHEYVFLGLPNEEEQVSEILNLADKLNSHLQRFEKLLVNRDKEIHQLKTEKKQLYVQLDAKNEEIRALNESLASLQNELKQINTDGVNPFNDGQFVGITDIGDGVRAYLVKTH
ncbi:hypothetical protein TCA2_4445 [Paenibacillus sp. TCA20]|uniref:MarR family transcriptional regulator n=1 Tax=Paenibacillus urinalis TaxID=521520 RepID=A0ABY7XHY3_9BACL|nr:MULTISPECIES: hypothetical protein [Paenibacillus]WDI05218.1 hypothetical protein PUW25_25760 [Paenibacillus urinalis]GAK41953.1 hypothetical protein TCA2_4445 [Paenibacillus sp. TCA20]